MPIFIPALIYAATTIYDYYRSGRWRGSMSDKPEPKQFTTPHVEEGRPIPIIYGSCKLDEPQILWFGNTASALELIQAHVWFGLCHGPGTGTEDKIWAIIIDQLGSRCDYITGGVTFPIGKGTPLDVVSSEPNGLLTRHEHIYGSSYLVWDLYSGAPAQTPAIPTGWTGNWPGYRGIVSASGGRHQLWGFNNWGVGSTLPAVTFVVSRCPHALTTNVQPVSGDPRAAGDIAYAIVGSFPDVLAPNYGACDSNPAEIIYDLLTNTVYGLGMPAANWIDTASFVTAAQTLYAESFGLSMRFDTQNSVEEMISDVLQHIEGALFADASNSGKLTLKLFRAADAEGTLPDLDESVIISLDEFSRPAWFDLINEVRVNYNAREWALIYDGATLLNIDWTINPRNAIAQHNGLFGLQGGFVSTTREYPGISQSALAAQIAARDLRELSTPLAHVRLTVNRNAYALTPGDCFTLSWPPLGISGLILRVMEIDYGQLESGRIVIDAVQDVFNLGTAIFSGVPPTEWEPTGTDPGWPETPTITAKPIEIIAVQNTPPGSPSDGDTYLVGASPTGAWADHADEIAIYKGTVWMFATPSKGWLIYDLATHRLLVYGAAGSSATRYLRPVDAPAILPIAVDPTDPTKELRVNLASIATGTARTLTMPNKNLTPMHVGGDTMSGLLNMGGNTISAGGLNQHGTVAQSASHSNPLAGKTIDLTLGMSTLLTLTGNIGDTGLTFSNWPASFDAEAILYVKQAGSGSYTIVWSAEIDWGDAGQPVLSATPGQVDILKFRRLGPGSGTVYAELMGNGYTY